MRIRLQTLLRGTALAAVMAAAISFAPGAARADDLGDAIRAALTSQFLGRTEAIAAVLNSTTDGAAMLSQLNAMSSSLPLLDGVTLGRTLGQVATRLSSSNPTAASQIQLALANNNSVGVTAGFSQTFTPAAGGGNQGGGGGGGGGFGLGNSGGGFGGGGGNPFSFQKIGPYQT